MVKKNMVTEPEIGYWNLGGPKTYSEADIDSAIAAGVLSTETAARLKQHLLSSTFPSPHTALAEEEHFRLIGGFNDIFVVIASVLLLFGLGRLLGPVHNSLIAASIAVTAWILAEYFVRRKHLALTAIVLLAYFAVGVFWGVQGLLPPLGDPMGAATWRAWGVHRLFQTMRSDYMNMIVPSAVTVLAIWLHWWRFHVPVSVACGVAAFLGLLLTTLITFFPAVKDALLPISFCFGLIVFALAMRWDSSDIIRQTRRSDVAFWLHLMAAPLLVHPLFSYLGVFSGKTTANLAWIMVALYAIIALLSLIIDRRALMVSSLSYVLYAFTVVFKEYGVIYEGLTVGALIIGTALLLLAALWQPVRARVMILLPCRLQKHLPPVRRV